MTREDTHGQQDFYGDEYDNLLESQQKIESALSKIRDRAELEIGRNTIEHFKARIKSAESMKKKLKSRNISITKTAAIKNTSDAVGTRLVVTFLDDIYDTVQRIKACPEIEVIEEKDYIKNPKKNGYRSYHLIVTLAYPHLNHISSEIQIRTIAMDCWASLEHQMKYKKHIKSYNFITRELKLCAAQIASTDVSLQTLKNMIEEEVH